MNPGIAICFACSDLEENVSYSSDLKGEAIIEGILGKVLPPAIIGVDDINIYPWKIDTKYYTATVNLCHLTRKTIGNREFAESIEAVIISFDSKKRNGLALVEQWHTFIRQFDPDVKMLVCSQIPLEDNKESGGVTRRELHSWCLRNKFELVELNPELQDDDDDLEDDFPESFGFKRINEALQAHIWPNLNLKTSKKVGAVSPINFENGKATGIDLSNIDNHRGFESEVETPSISLPTSTIDPSSDSINIVKPTVHSTTCPANVANSSSSHESDPVNTGQKSPTNDSIDSVLLSLESMSSDKFEDLFERLNEMKLQAARLSPNQRKSYAEKMAIAFWRSIGGSESEIENLSDSD